MIAKKFSANNRFRISHKITASVLVLLSMSSAMYFYTASPKYSVSIPDLNKGASVVLKTNDNIIVIGAGDSLSDYNKIKNEVLKTGKRQIDYLILPSANKVFSAGAPEMAFNNPEIKVIYPKSGNYSDKLDYISNENFLSFDDTTTINIGSDEIISFADLGCTANFKDFSLIIYGNFEHGGKIK